MPDAWMIYGANGYTGTLTAELAVARGERPILAGRDLRTIGPLATRLGLDFRVFGLNDARAAAAAMSGVGAVVNMAGPFSATARPMIDACLLAKAHYLDITGEIAVFEDIFTRDEEARAAGITLIPGAGFDVVPTDCLAAALAAEVPGATELELAMSGLGPALPSRGTLRTMVEGLRQGNFVRVAGKLTDVHVTWRTPAIPFPGGPRECVTLGWGDVATAWRTTGIPNICVYFGANPGMIRVLAGLRPVFASESVQDGLKWIIGKLRTGPSEGTRKAAASEIWGRARNAAGRSVSGAMRLPEGYGLTADSAIRCVRKVLAGLVPPGAHTPASAFGKDFVRELDGVTAYPMKSEGMDVRI